MTLSHEHIAKLCDHTFLTPAEAFRKEAKTGESAIHLRRKAFDRFLAETLAGPLFPYAVCIPSADVAYTKGILPPHFVIAATVGFPDGPRHSTAHKILETQMALEAGAAEIDMVLDYDALKRQQLDVVQRDLEAVADVVHARDGILKVILEICELDLDQTHQACQLVDACGAAFVKTSTGFGFHGATVEHLRVMRNSFTRGIKISGGVQMQNLNELLSAATHPNQAMEPSLIRIGESSLLAQLASGDQP